MNIACALSLQDNENAGKQKERSLAALRPRLAKLGLERVEVQPFGDCQFLAALFSAFVPLDCQEFRAQVCQSLKHCASQFWKKILPFQEFRPVLGEHDAPQAWGDEFTLCAMSHLLQANYCAQRRRKWAWKGVHSAIFHLTRGLGISGLLCTCFASILTPLVPYKTPLLKKRVPLKKRSQAADPKGWQHAFEQPQTGLKLETCGKMSDIPHTGTDQQRWNSWFNAVQHA